MDGVTPRSIGELGDARAAVGAQVLDQARAALRLPHARILRGSRAHCQLCVRDLRTVGVSVRRSCARATLDAYDAARWPTCSASFAAWTRAARRAARSPCWPSTTARTCARSCGRRIPGPSPTREMVDFKRAVVRALGTTGTGVLLDPEIGVAPAIADGSLPGRAGLIVAVEATGYEGPAAPGSAASCPAGAWTRIKRLGASAAKLLVYYHPDAPNAADQERLVAEVAARVPRRRTSRCSSSRCRSASTAAKLTGEDAAARRGRDRAPADRARRGRAQGRVPVRRAASPTRAAGARPAPSSTPPRPVPWVLLSGGVDDATFERQVARRVPGGRERRARRAVRVGRGRDAGAGGARRVPRHDRARRASRGSSSLVDDVGAPWRPRWAAAPPARGARPRLVRALLSVRRRLRRGATSTCSSSARSTPTSSSRTRTRARSSARPSGSSRASASRSAARRRSPRAAPRGSGLAVSLVGVVGDDALGRFMLEALADRGVDVSACRVAPGRPTGASVILGNGTDRAILTAIGHDRATCAPPTSRPALLRGPATSTPAATSSSRALAAELPALFRAARAAGATTSLDPNWDPSGAGTAGSPRPPPRRTSLLPERRRGRRGSTGLDDVAAAARVARLDVRRAGRGRSPSSAAPDGGARRSGPDGALEPRRRRSPSTPSTRPARATRSTPGSSRRGSTAGRSTAALRLGVACGSLSTRAAGGTDGQPTRAEAEAAVRAMAARVTRGRRGAPPIRRVVGVVAQRRGRQDGVGRPARRRGRSIGRSSGPSSPGGKAANVVRAARHLGLDGAVVAVLGGHAGAWYREALAERAIGAARGRRSPARPGPACRCSTSRPAS